MRYGFTIALSLAAVLALAGRALAYPPDSLLLVRVVTATAGGDTLDDYRYSYSVDHQGYWYERKTGFRGDTLTDTEVKTYDAHGRAIAESSSTRTKSGPLNISTRTEFDAAGLPLSAVLRYNDTLTLHFGYQYDGAGRVLKWTITGDASDPVPYAGQGQYEYAYDAGGRLETRTYAVNGVLKETNRITYDSAGRPATQLSLNSNGDTTYAKTFAYDPSGKQVQEISEYGKDTLSLLYSDERTEYDGQGNVKAKKRYGKSGTLEFIDTYTYQTVSVPVSLGRFRRRTSGIALGNSASDGFRDVLGRTPARQDGHGSYPRIIARKAGG
jgi:hypothetical protein